MALEKTTAIVLRVIAFSETSCIVTMMTREYGKITAIAKGARRPKSPFEAALDVLAMCRIVFLHKSSTAMDLLTEAKLERRFRCGASSLPRLYAGYYVAELLNLLTDDADPHADLFDLAVETIENIDRPSSKAAAYDEADLDELDRTIMNFELKSLTTLGHVPMLTQCVGCGRKKQTLNRVSFGMNAGGILCGRCRAGHQNVVSLSSNGLSFLLTTLQQSLEPETEEDEANSSETFDVASDLDDQDLRDSVEDVTNHDAAIDEVRSLIRNYTTHLIGHRPRLQKFLPARKRKPVR